MIFKFCLYNNVKPLSMLCLDFTSAYYFCYSSVQDECKEGASGHPPAAELPLEQTDRPTSKKTALEDLLGGTFDEPVAQHISQIDAELISTELKHPFPSIAVLSSGGKRILGYTHCYPV